MLPRSHGLCIYVGGCGHLMVLDLGVVVALWSVSWNRCVVCHGPMSGCLSWPYGLGLGSRSGLLGVVLCLYRVLYRGIDNALFPAPLCKSGRLTVLCGL